MTIDQLIYYMTVVEVGSINKASIVLGMAQQSLSHSIRVLEVEVKTPLLKRTNKGVFTTNEGQAFYYFAKNIVYEYENMLQLIRHKSPLQMGQLSISTVDSVTTCFLPQFAIAFYKRYPHIKLKIYKEILPNILTQIKNNDVDGGIILRYQTMDGRESLLNEDEFDIYPIARCRSYLWVSINSPLAQFNSLSIQQIIKEPMLIKENVDMALFDFIYNDYDLNYFDFPLGTEVSMIGELVANNLAVCPDIQIGNKNLNLAHTMSWLPVVAVPIKLLEGTQIDACLVINKNFKGDQELLRLFVESLLAYAGF